MSRFGIIVLFAALLNCWVADAEPETSALPALDPDCLGKFLRPVQALPSVGEFEVPAMPIFGEIVTQLASEKDGGNWSDIAEAVLVVEVSRQSGQSHESIQVDCRETLCALVVVHASQHASLKLPDLTAVAAQHSMKRLAAHTGSAEGNRYFTAVYFARTSESTGQPLWQLSQRGQEAYRTLARLC